MSEWRERYEDSPGVASALEWLESYYQYVVGALVLVFMLYLRIRSWENFIVDGEVLFGGNDPWYHFRNTLYSVEHWPATMPFDPWTYFPYGNASGQFGTFFDQIMATLAMVLGLGSPSEELVAMVVLVVPVLLGVLIAIPTYVMARRVGGRFGGVVALIVLALSAGRLLDMSLVGFPDHHVAEAFFQTLGVLGVLTAVGVAQRDKPIYEQFAERSIGPIRGTVAWSVLAGVAISTYLWVWPPGVLIVGILGVYFLLQLTVEFLRDESPEHTAIAGAITMATVGVVVLGSLDSVAISATEHSLLQPLLAFLVAGGCLFMAWLARVWETRDRPRWQYPVTVFGLIIAGVVLLRVLAPGVFGFFVNNLLRVVGFSTSPTAGTIGEAAPIPFSQAGLLFEWYGFAILVAAGAAIYIAGRTLLRRDVGPEPLLLLVWFLFITAATFTQQRFGYYLTIVVAVLTGYAVGVVFDRFDLRFGPASFETHKALTVGAVISLLVVPMVFGPTTAMNQTRNVGPGNDIRGWSESLEWAQEHTPVEGRYADETAELDLYGTYARTDDFDYEPGAYGVLSWWDYGHWITVQGERIPTANPHQQGSDTAANFLLAPNESQANDVIARMSENDSETRYVMADWKMVNTYTRPVIRNERQRINGKFFAPITFYNVSDVSRSEYWGTLYFEQEVRRGVYDLYTFNYKKQPYYESMVTRLYKYHGSAREPQPVVIDWEQRQSQVAGSSLPMTWSGSPQVAIRSFDNMTAAREYVANDTSAQIGGFGGNPSERVPALEHYRYVGSAAMDSLRGQGYQVSKSLTAFGLGVNRSATPYFDDPSSPWTKMFERVPGATVEGTGPANANVTASVEMRNEVTNETFTYHQRVQTDAGGAFTMTVPYSTTGYDEWGPEQGRTNVSVRATGPYEFRAITAEGGNATAWQANAEVPEGAVIGETTEPISVDLEAVATDGQQADDGTESG